MLTSLLLSDQDFLFDSFSLSHGLLFLLFLPQGCSPDRLKSGSLCFISLSLSFTLCQLQSRSLIFRCLSVGSDTGFGQQTSCLTVFCEDLVGLFFSFELCGCLGLRNKLSLHLFGVSRGSFLDFGGKVFFCFRLYFWNVAVAVNTIFVKDLDLRSHNWSDDLGNDLWSDNFTLQRQEHALWFLYLLGGLHAPLGGTGKLLKLESILQQWLRIS